MCCYFIMYNIFEKTEGQWNCFSSLVYIFLLTLWAFFFDRLHFGVEEKSMFIKIFCKKWDTFFLAFLSCCFYFLFLFFPSPLTFCWCTSFIKVSETSLDQKGSDIIQGSKKTDGYLEGLEKEQNFVLKQHPEATLFRTSARVYSVIQ